MTTSTATKPKFNEIEQARRTFMNGLASVPDFATAMGRSKRTIERLIAIGDLPVVYLGRVPFVNVAAARSALEKPPGPSAKIRKTG